jgi:Arc/MetJ-type ribon-helix-helix transcriptional regulator
MLTYLVNVYKKYWKNVGKIKMSKRILWSIQVPSHLDEKLEQYIKLDAYQTKSEFIRTAVRDRLRDEMEQLTGESATSV